jgi:hypothetical protein
MVTVMKWGQIPDRPPFLTQEGTPHDVEYECQDDGDKDGKHSPNKSTLTIAMSVRTGLGDLGRATAHGTTEPVFPVEH